MTETTPNTPSLFRVGAVAYLNARPLIHGLDTNPRVAVTREVPSKLAGLLDAGTVDVALVPVIDLLSGGQPRKIVSNACIGSDGATLTVRVFSRVDPADIIELHVDADSHSSVALASVLWLEKYNRRLELVPFAAGDARADTLRSCQAVLLIGDKVIAPPVGIDAFSTQVDLGATWKSITGLPFVFAVWAAGQNDLPAGAAAILERARDDGVEHAAEIAERFAPAAGWPLDLARRYLTEYLNFTLTNRHREAMRVFHEMTKRHGLINAETELVFA